MTMVRKTLCIALCLVALGCDQPAPKPPTVTSSAAASASSTAPSAAPSSSAEESAPAGPLTKVDPWSLNRLRDGRDMDSYALQWRPRGRMISRATEAGVDLIDLDATPLRGRRLCENSTIELFWHPEGSKLTTRDCGKGGVELWSSNTGKLIANWDNFYPHSSFSHDGSVMLITTGNFVWRWLDGKTHAEVGVHDPQTAATGSSYPYWSPTGNIAVMVTDGGGITVVSGKTGKGIRDIRIDGGSGSEPKVAWHPSGTMFAVTGGHYTSIFDSKGTKIFESQQPELEAVADRWPHDIQYGNGGKTLYLLRNAELLAFGETGKNERALARGAAAMSASPDSEAVIYQTHDGLYLIAPSSTESRLLQETEGAEAPRIVWLPGGERVAIYDAGRISFHDVDSPKRAEVAVSKEVAGVALSLDGKVLAVGGRGLELVRVTDRAKLHVELDAANAGPARTIAYTSSGHFEGDAKLATSHLSALKKQTTPRPKLIADFFAGARIP